MVNVYKNIRERKGLKRISYMRIYTLLLLVFLLLSGQLALADDYNNIAISGKVHNPSAKEIRVVLYSYVPGELPLSSSAVLEQTNEFHFVSYVREPVFGELFYGKEKIPLYIEPGYNIRITFDSEKFQESIQISGVGAQNNSFLVARAFRFGTEQNELREKIKKYDAAEFAAWAAGKRKSQLELLNARQSELSTAFVNLQQADIEYTRANELFAFYRFREENRKKNSAANAEPDFVDEVKLHNYDVIVLKSYQEFLENYLQYNYSLMKQSLPEESSQYYTNMYRVAKSSLRSLPMYHMQAVYLTKALNYLGVDYVKDEYIEFANECPNQAYKNILHQMVKAQTVTPKKPEVIFTDKKGRTVPLKELAGNIVLLRFTNHVSDSAIQLIRKHDKLLKERLVSYKDVKFLELPMDYNQEAYTKMVYADATEYLKSIMNRPKPGQEKSETPSFSYILLNRDGLVVSNSLDDPGNELAMEKIDALLRQEKRNAQLEIE